MPQGYELKNFTSWKAGGSCALFVAPHTADEALDFLKCCREAKRKCFVLGGGTNVLAADGFTDIAVLYTGHIKGLAAFETAMGITELEVACGCTTKQLMAYALQHSLTGTEFLTGIPGTVGGALFGNAGGRSETGFNAIVKEITVITAECEIKKYGANELVWQYRSCPVAKTDCIMSCRLQLAKADRHAITEKIKGFAELKKGQPIGKATAGCVFKNPKGMSAGKMLDEAGCRGMKFGDAMVSFSHANFIENVGQATATEIYELCERCRREVFDKYGVELEYEIKFLGNFA